MRPADFRSDTVTQACAAMREAMATAEVGDDVLEGDPTVRRLEEAAAAWLGKEGALFVPSGTMANQVALGAWTRPGDELICQRYAHVTTFEAGAAGFLLKQTSASDVCRAIRDVSQGRTFFSPAISRRLEQLVPRITHRAGHVDHRPVQLTSREMETLQLIAKGKAS